jgi:hypothetical protein
MSLPGSQSSWFDSTEVGAPTLNNAVGSLLEVLRVCLVNGFNSKSVTSIVVAGGVATATAATHGYTSAYGKLVLIEGSAETLLNGRKQPLSVSTNTFTFAAPGVADGTYTGTITAKRAPLGWVEAHTGTNKAIFSRSAPEATAMLLRVNDTHSAPSTSTICRLLCLESATDVDTYTGLSPTNVQFADGVPWQKGADNATAKTWALIGNDRCFYLATQLGTSSTFAFYFFGDGVNYYAGDAYFTLITGQSGTTYSTTPGLGLDNLISYDAAPSGVTSIFASRGQPVSSTGSEISDIAGPNCNRPGGNNMQPVSFEHIAISETVHVIGALKQVRGEMPGLAVPFAAAPFTAFQLITSASGAVYLAVPYNAGGTPGQWLVRLSGAWH